MQRGGKQQRNMGNYMLFYSNLNLGEMDLYKTCDLQEIFVLILKLLYNVFAFAEEERNQWQ